MALLFFKKFESWFFLIAVLFFSFICPGVSMAQAVGDPAATDQELVITADRLDADAEGNYSEFSGNVKAVQGDTIITADRIRIDFKSSRNSSGQLSVGEDAVEKITATGHVKISTGEMTALTNKASYVTASRLLVLSGPDSTVKSGKNSITGAKITMDRASGRITVENNATNQVRALFFTNGKGLN